MSAVTLDAMPGQSHPALAHFAAMVRHRADETSISIAIYAPSSPIEPMVGPVALAYRNLRLERRKLTQSLYPEYGAYVWTAWVDEFGRCIGCDDVVWVENPRAFLLPPWNPS